MTLTFPTREAVNMLCFLSHPDPGFRLLQPGECRRGSESVSCPEESVASLSPTRSPISPPTERGSCPGRQGTSSCLLQRAGRPLSPGGREGLRDAGAGPETVQHPETQTPTSHEQTFTAELTHLGIIMSFLGFILCSGQEVGQGGERRDSLSLLHNYKMSFKHTWRLGCM